MLSAAVLLKNGQDVFESDINTVNTQHAEQFAARAAFPHCRFIMEIAILFLRKAMALRGVEFAAMLRVDRITVSRWENNRVQIDGLSDFRLRLEAIDKLLPPTARRDLVEELAAIFQHGYRSDISISQGEIVVPKKERPQERPQDECIPA